MRVNKVIEAGAGTGKTTRLIQTLIQAILFQKIPVDRIVALTFTKKAAGEMKDRLGKALDDVLQAPTLDSLKQKSWWPSDPISLKFSDLQETAREARPLLDQAEVGTIHSYAYGLVKAYPIQSGVHPNAEIDEKGVRFETVFDLEWERWLNQELSDGSPHTAEWMSLLPMVSLADIRTLAKGLANFRIPLSLLPLRTQQLSGLYAEWARETESLLASRENSTVAGATAKACLQVFLQIQTMTQSESAAILESLQNQKPSKNKAWDANSIYQLKKLQKIAIQLLNRSDEKLSQLTALLKPFLQMVQRGLLKQGILTHNALLHLANDLLKNHPDIRTQIKKRIDLILIDEFQDTDPLQAEMILFLAEKISHTAASWDKTQLEPGKLFLVGDPKQSIYRFRGADMAAYDLIAQHIESQGGAREVLGKNYRSHPNILSAVNSAFSTLIQQSDGISPTYRSVESGLKEFDATHAAPKLELWLSKTEAAQTSVEVQQKEAEAVAQWILSETNQRVISDGKGGYRRLERRDIALIFRSYHAMDAFLESFRTHQIPFLVEGERHFYESSEVRHFVNLLRVIQNPEDRLHWVGYLRSSFGGVPDPLLIQLQSENLLSANTPLPERPEYEPLQAPWNLIQTYHRRAQREPLSHLLEDLFDETYIQEMTLRSYHGLQTHANLTKLKRLLIQFSEHDGLSLTELLTRLDLFFSEELIEGENPLADESFDAVRLFTVHKSKGLEFPVVFLPSLHPERVFRQTPDILFDWQTERLGLRLGGFQNIEKIFLDDEMREKEEAEEKRILYVGMTRPKELLILSGGINLKRKGTHSFLQELARAWGIDLDTLSAGTTQMGESLLHVKHLTETVFTLNSSSQSPVENSEKTIDLKSFARHWKAKESERTEWQSRTLWLKPSAHKPSVKNIDLEAEENTALLVAPVTATVNGKQLGTLVHRFLELWDFSKSEGEMPPVLSAVSQHLKIPKDLQQEAQALLKAFMVSEAYQHLKTVKIVGKEVPFISVMDKDQHVRGFVDLAYQEADGSYVLADYKTDISHTKDFKDLVLNYQEQLNLYAKAWEAVLSAPIKTQLILIRYGVIKSLYK